MLLDENHQSFPEILRRHARRTPEKTAISFNGDSLSWSQIDHKIEHLAHCLLEKGAKANEPVAICMDRSINMLVAVAAVLRAGACYVPIDPNYPDDRVRFMLENSQAGLILSSDETAAELSAYRGEVIDVASVLAAVEDQPVPDLQMSYQESDLAYIIYTSGSTGQPKGVALPRRALRNLITWQEEKAIPGGGKTLQFASLSFDVSFQEIFSTWYSGSELVLISEDDRKDPERVFEILEQSRIERLFLPFSVLHNFADFCLLENKAPAQVRHVITAGEQLRITDAIRWFFKEMPDCRLHNHYGPSETHVVTALTLSKNPARWPALPTIGKAVPGCEVLILNEALQPVKQGEAGELYLGGICLADGYWQNTSLSQERFIPHPNQIGQRLYRSGDSGKRLKNGQIKFLGRKDDQVKIRGHRVELGEIEAVLDQHSDIDISAVKVIEEDSGHKQLAAYYVAASESVDDTKLRTHIKSQLPAYMIPAYFRAIDSMPKTASGKIDRRNLPAIEFRSAAPLVNTATGSISLENQIRAVWCKVLGIEHAAGDDNFFDLGGDSVLLGRVLVYLRRELEQTLSFTELFSYPTIASLTEFLKHNKEEVSTVIPNSAAAGSGDIAIVGMAGRFPGAENVDELWENIVNNVESITFFDEDELAEKPPAELADQFVAARSVLKQPDMFDADFFKYTPREAAQIDPQQRVFLECAWQALEDAGYNAEAFPGAIGVFAGASMGTYLLSNLMENRQRLEEITNQFQVGGYQTVTGNDKDYLATRIAYKLNLRGPAMTIQTACSTSLVAIAQACQSIREGQCDMALAGGVSISFPQNRGYLYIEGSLASQDGHCRPFDANAKGTVFGAGAGVIVLKRLEDAIADGDTIHAVVKGAGVNNDGSRKAGFMAPSPAGQAAAIRAAQEQAGIAAESIGYVETHGTGTPLGDPIEFDGLQKAFNSSKTGFCALGSLKANIGHLETAAGVAGVIKTVMALKHKKIPAMLHYQAPNPQIALQSSPFFIPTELSDWKDGNSPRRAGISSFGVGGTNAHLILEEAPKQIPAANEDAKYHILPLSAKTREALEEATQNLLQFLIEHPEANLQEVAYTLQVGRKHFQHRRVVVATSIEDAIEALRQRDPKRLLDGQSKTAPASIVFMFPGQGAQHVNMGKNLYDSEALFREIVDQCAEILQPLLNVDIRSLLYPVDDNGDAAEALKQTAITQPALFVIQYALARLWMSRGVRPDAMIGHSVGEYTAACLAGVFSLEDALSVLAERARLMQSQPSGSMLAVRTDAASLPKLPESISVAALNSPNLTVLSGPTEAIEALHRQFQENDIISRQLHTSHAFHSAMMEPTLAPFSAKVASVDRHQPQIPFISSLTGNWISDEEALNPDYWAQQVREAVRFSPGINQLQKQAGRLLIEVGPGKTLSTLALQHPNEEADQRVVASLGHAREASNDVVNFHLAIGSAWIAGYQPNWSLLYDGQLVRRIPLPTYPFQRQSYWVEPPITSGLALTAANQQINDDAQTSDEIEATEAIVDTASRPERLVRDMQQILSDQSGIDPQALDPERTFLELGFDSLFLTQVSLAFKKAFKVNISLRQLIDDYPTMNALAGFVDRTLPEAANMPAPAAKLSAAPQAAPRPAENKVQAEKARIGTERHGPYSPINTAKSADHLHNRQRDAIEGLMRRYQRKTGTSKAMTQKHRAHFADPRAVAGFNDVWKEITYPVISKSSNGSRITDVDGNEYVDVTMGFGTNIFGHNPKFIREALEKQLKEGIEIGPQSPIAGKVAAMLCEFSGQDRATFCNTGSEAVLGAIRAARTVSGRDKIAFFVGDYHGVNDEVLVRGSMINGRPKTFPIAPGIPMEMVDNVLLLPYGEQASLDILREELPNLAAIMVEPVQSRQPELQPYEFLQALRRMTRDTETALIFDEVITGFRIAPGGAQEWFDIDADLVTYGKIIGGGMPIGAIAGQKRYMDAFDGGFWQYGDASFPEAGVTFFAGTFVRHPLAMAGAEAALTHLKEEGPQLQEELRERTAKLVGEINTIYEKEDIPIRITHFGSNWYFFYDKPMKFFSLLFHFLRDRGLHIWEGRPCFISTAHSDEDLAFIVDCFRSSAIEMRDAGLFELPSAKFLKRAARIMQQNNQKPDGIRRLALTPAQMEIWLAAQLDPKATCAFNESCTVSLGGELDDEALKRAFSRLVDRHEALRTTFARNGEYQQIARQLTIDVRQSDYSTLPDATRRQHLEDRLAQETSIPFDLTAGPLIRAELIKLSADAHVLIVTAHHIICDGWSYDVMIRDLGALYRSETGYTNTLPEQPGQFSEYVSWLDDTEQQSLLTEARRYWLSQFPSGPSVLDLPTDHPRPSIRSFDGARAIYEVDSTIYEKIKTFSQKQNCTLNVTLLAAYTNLLYRLTGQEQLVVGMPAAGQALVDNPLLVGHCTNMLPLHINSMDRPFSDLLAHVKSVVLDGFENQTITFGELIQELGIRTEPDRSPFVATSFNVDPAIHNLDFAGLSFDIEVNPRSAFQFDFGFNLVASNNKLIIECDYNTNLFDSETIYHWMGTYELILQGIEIDASAPISRQPLMNKTSQQLLDKLNATERALPAQQTIHDLFSLQANGNAAERIIHFLQDDNSSADLSYQELDERSNQLANHLIHMGIQRGQFVGIYYDRCPDMLIAMMGILKAGAAYLPLDPSFPADRIAYMLADSVAPLLITRDKLSEELGNVETPMLCLDRDWLQIGEASTEPANMVVDGNDLAYLIYTSGSTGKPKGVQISHHAAVNFLITMAEDAPGFTKADTLLAVTTISFDISVLELFMPLVSGGNLVVASAEHARDGKKLAHFLDRYGVTVMQATPATWRLLLNSGWTGNQKLKVLCGGEAFPPTLAGELLARCGEVWNMYGPTETTVWSLVEQLKTADEIFIGKPIANTRIYVLDELKQPAPPGVPGELFIAGSGLSKGYLKREELTSSKFLDLELNGKPERIYGTGDLVRFRHDCRIEFLGRIDYQIKLRGYRIEPGEIEAHLQNCAGIREAVVIARGNDSASQQLVAYYLPEEGGTFVQDAVIAHLKDNIPAYMIPNAFVEMSAFPLTPNGKIDRKQLPAPEANNRPAAGDNTQAAQDALELQLTQIWESVLGTRPVSIDDDFFMIGGHSLLAVKLFSRIEKLMGINLPLAALLQAPSIRGLAEVIRADNWQANWSSVVPIQPGGSLPPLFCVHGAGGNVLLYRDLALHLGSNQPLYGLQAQGLDGKTDFYTRFEDMAAHYVSEMRKLQPEGPYYLAGYCLGGNICVEIARQLESQGQEVALLAMLESYNMASVSDLEKYSTPFYRYYHKMQNIKYHFDNMMSPRNARKLSFLKQKFAVEKSRAKMSLLTKWSNVAGSFTDISSSKLPYIVMDSIHDTALELYVPNPVSARGILFRPEKDFAGFDDPAYGWTHIFPDGLEIEHFPASPRGMLVEPYVKKLARKLRRKIQEAAGREMNEEHEAVEVI